MLADVRSGSSLCENALWRSIVFSIAFFPKEVVSTIDSHIDEIEMEVLHASWTSEFSHSLGQNGSVRARAARLFYPQEQTSSAAPACPFGANSRLNSGLAASLF
jgi:hypothetical protein